jgi:hypothetical protein
MVTAKPEPRMILGPASAFKQLWKQKEDWNSQTSSSISAGHAHEGAPCQLCLTTAFAASFWQ